MKNTFKSAAFTVLICLTISFIISFTSSPGDNRLGGAGLLSFGLGFMGLILGAVVCISKKGREIGKGILLGSGILILIGFSVCAANFHGA